MDAEPKSLEKQLANALHENEALKQSLDECSVARQNAEQELARAVANGSAAMEDMGHFVYAVSHDFRQPLRAIFSYAQLLQRHYSNDQQASEMTAFILDGANEMKQLIDDLLKYSRIGTSPRRTTVNLGTVVQWGILNLQNAVQDAGAQILYGDLPDVAIDESQFVQLFQQLFSNSLKFRSSEAPKIEVTAEQQPEGYLFSVRDNGIGIESKYHETVFAPFKRLHGREVPGTGLGLAICRKIVLAHGGKMWVESDGQHGSAFRFTLPF